MSQSQQSFVVEAFRPSDADGIVRLFRTVYGDGYPIRLFYASEAVLAAHREGRYIYPAGLGRGDRRRPDLRFPGGGWAEARKPDRRFRTDRTGRDGRRFRAPSRAPF